MLQTVFRSVAVVSAAFLLLGVALLGGGCAGSPQAEFSANATSGAAPLKVTFTNTSRNADRFQWEFGDGSGATTSTVEEAATHEYTKAGDHTVTLAAAKAGKPEDTSTASAVIRVGSGLLGRVVLDTAQISLSPEESHTFSVQVFDRFDNPIAGATVAYRCDERAGRVDGNGVFVAGTKPAEYKNGVTVEVTEGDVTRAASATVVVGPGPLERVVLEPGELSLEVGQQQKLAASGLDRYGNPASGVEFVYTSNEAAGKVDGQGTFTAGTKAGKYADAVKVEARQGAVTKSVVAGAAIAPGPLDSVVVDPGELSLEVGKEQRVNAAALDAYDNPIPGIALTYTCDARAGAIDGDGLFTAATKPGTYSEAVRVQATQGAVTRAVAASVAIGVGPLDRVVIEPAELNLPVGQQLRLNASALDRYDNPIPGVPLTYTCDVGAGAVDSDGLLTAGTKPGMYSEAVKVEATQGAVMRAVAASVAIGAGPLNRVVLEPAEISLSVGEQQRLSAAALDRYDNPIPDVAFTFVCDAGAGTIDREGVFTAGTKPGTYEGAIKVEATEGAVTRSAVAEAAITPGPLERVALEPGAIILEAGAQQRLNAAALDRYDNRIPDVAFTYVSDAAAGAVDPQGVFTAGTKAGTYEDAVKVEAAQGSVMKSVMGKVTIQHGALDQVRVVPGVAVLDIGEEQGFTVEAVDRYDNLIPEVQLSYEIAEGLGVLDKGILTAGTKADSFADGVVVTATLGEVSARAAAVVTVRPGPPEAVGILPVEVVAGESIQLSAVVTDRYGNAVGDVEGTWSLANPRSGLISESGLLKAGEVAGVFEDAVQVQVKQGTAVRIAVASVTIEPGTLQQVVVVPNPAALGMGMSQQFVVVGADRYGNRLTGLTSSWSVDAGGGTIDASGLFTAGSEPETYDGTVKVSLSDGGTTRTATATVIVEPDRIAFISDRGDEQPDIYVMDASGEHVERLTDTALLEFGYSWSPDGRRIAIDGPGQGISVIGDDGGWEVLIAEDSEDRLHLFPAWSPDGTKIAFTALDNWLSRSGEDTTEIFVMDLDGGNVTQLTDTADGEESYPAWSPDGTKLAFVFRPEGQKREIYVMNADGSDRRRLTSDPGEDGYPVWSPDGSMIAFMSDRDGDYEIYVFNANGVYLQQLTSNSGIADMFPSWSPDGRQIVFASDRHMPEEDQGQIYVMDADGRNVRRLTDNSADEFFPQWAPRKRGVEVAEHSVIVPYVSAAGGATVQEVTESARRAVVRIKTDLGSGSGFVIDPQGLILTNNHVISGAEEITVFLDDGSSYPGTVEARDVVRDLATVRIEATDLPFLEIGDLSGVRLGQQAVVLGYPLGKDKMAVTSGFVSAIESDSGRNIIWVRTDSAINPGNSGGPLLDLQGKVIGVVAAKTVGIAVEGVGFAISANTVNLYLPRMEPVEAPETTAG